MLWWQDSGGWSFGAGVIVRRTTSGVDLEFSRDGFVHTGGQKYQVGCSNTLRERLSRLVSRL